MAQAEIDVVEMIQECRRERKMRERVYPHRIAYRQINQRVAHRQMAVLERIQEVLELLLVDRTALPQVLREREPRL